MSKESRGNATRPANVRASVLIGTRLLPTTDGRSVWARIVREMIERLVAHCGGEDQISETMRLQARRCAIFEAELLYLEEQMAQARANDEAPQPHLIATYTTITNAQRRTCEALGYDRTQHDVGIWVNE